MLFDNNKQSGAKLREADIPSKYLRFNGPVCLEVFSFHFDGRVWIVSSSQSTAKDCQTHHLSMVENQFGSPFSAKTYTCATVSKKVAMQDNLPVIGTPTVMVNPSLAVIVGSC